MAYDKVVDSTVLNTGLTKIAKAIREKGGISASLAFPADFESAIEAIETGITPSGTKTVTENGTYDVTEYACAEVAIPEVEQATPEITVSSSGLITATAGDKSATKQMDTQAGTTVTPGTSAKTPVDAGKYTTGKITVKGDANLTASNIKKGVSIFNVTGTYEGTSSGGIDTSDATATENDMAEGVTAYVNGEKITGNLKDVKAGSGYTISGEPYLAEDKIYSFGYPALDAIFREGSILEVGVDCSEFGDATAADVAKGKTFTSASGLKLTGTYEGTNSGGGGADQSTSILDKSIASYSNSTLTELGAYTLRDCRALTTLDLPAVTAVGSYACYNCNKLNNVNIPVAKTAGQYAFYGCSALTSLSLPAMTSLGSNRIVSGSKLKSLDLGVCTNLAANSLNGCTVLDTIILRSSTMCTLANVSALAGTPFASGNAGGAVYVPSALIATYQAATNWSTLYSGGTCTFKAIEESEYE